MTKKDFIELAGIFAKLRLEINAEDISAYEDGKNAMWGLFFDETISFCGRQTPAFNAEKFARACKKKK